MKIINKFIELKKIYNLKFKTNNNEVLTNKEKEISLLSNEYLNKKIEIFKNQKLAEVKKSFYFVYFFIFIYIYIMMFVGIYNTIENNFFKDFTILLFTGIYFYTVILAYTYFIEQHEEKIKDLLSQIHQIKLQLNELMKEAHWNNIENYYIELDKKLAKYIK